MMKTTLTALVALVLAGLLALPADAHTAMLQGSPDRNAVVGGSIGVIDLEFLDSISNAAVTLTYNGAPVAGQTTVTEGEIITFTLAQPLTQPGRYQVSYEMISLDGDFTTGGYFFTFDPAAAQPARIEPGSADGLSSTTLGALAIGCAVAAGLLAIGARQVSNRRREQFV